MTIYGAGEPSQVIARRVTPDSVFAARRPRAPGPDARRDSHEAVLSDRLWQRQFHGDPA